MGYRPEKIRIGAYITGDLRALDETVDSQAPLRHMVQAATVASFRTWRDLRPCHCARPGYQRYHQAFYGGERGIRTLGTV